MSKHLQQANHTYNLLQGLPQSYLRQAWLKLRSLFLRLSMGQARFRENWGSVHS